jgi:hypothetical protein
MKRNFSYLLYIIKHKWFVLQAGLGIGVPIIRLLIHDWSKFLPSEWTPYAHTFYDSDGNGQYEPHKDFDRAWNHHQKRNKHHWQYWVINRDDGTVKCIPMPEKYMREMISDWMGAGRTITGRWEVIEWYDKNYDKIKLHPDTRKKVNILLSYERKTNNTRSD